MEELLLSVKKVGKEAKKLNTTILPKFPESTFRDNFKPKLGDARYEGQLGPVLYVGPEPP